MIYIRRVIGQSMLPTLQPGQVCVFIKRRRYQAGDVVLAKTTQRFVVKRLFTREVGWQLRGDNYQASNTYEVGQDSSGNKVVAKLLLPFGKSFSQ